ncbi:hypothetical protein BURK1_01323 [Burkholderiales bacterium]|nr:hypothetical protein BURK1_01323 [Burkholderiales bacterium]
MSAPTSATPTASPAPRARYTRVALHLAGLVAAGLIAWLLWRGWRQPELLLDLAGMRLC